jgi:hypothetical protein
LNVSNMGDARNLHASGFLLPVSTAAARSSLISLGQRRVAGRRAMKADDLEEGWGNSLVCLGRTVYDVNFFLPPVSLSSSLFLNGSVFFRLLASFAF